MLKACNYALFLILWKLIKVEDLWTARLHGSSFYLLLGVSLIELFLVTYLGRQKPYGFPEITIAYLRIPVLVVRRMFNGFVQDGFFKFFGMWFAVYFMVEWFNLQVSTHRVVQYINAYILVFFASKVRWLVLNLLDERQIVDFLQGTSWKTRLAHPKMEFLYCFSTGITTLMGQQVPRMLLLLLLPERLVSSMFITGAVMGIVLAVLGDWEFDQATTLFLKHHTDEHCTENYIYHFEHHDVLPLASIGSAENGYLEGVIRGFQPFYFNSIFHVGLTEYINTMLSECVHNYVPTFCPFGLAVKFCHAEHHFNHAEPYGVVPSKEKHFEYNEKFWTYAASKMKRPIEKLDLVEDHFPFMFKMLKNWFMIEFTY
jgi:hypothetical protein